MALTPLQENGATRSGAGCLDAELLASYVDGRTTPEERVKVEAHLAECEDCYFAFSETVQQQQAEPAVEPEESEPQNRWRAWAPRLGIGLAVAAALVIGVRFYGPASYRTNGPDADLKVALTRLDAAMGTYRPLEPRLAGGFLHRPVEPVQRSGTTGDDAPLSVREAALAVEKIATAPGAGVAGERARAEMFLMTGKPQRAVEILAPLAKSSKDAGLLTDTAAAYIARREPGDPARGLDIAEQAVEAEPGRAEAWFNLALAAEALGLPSRAKEAWTKYLELDPSSGWAGEARRHLESLNKPRRPEVWQRERPKLEDALRQLDRPRLLPVVSDFTEEARGYLDDELLPAWATAQIDADSSVANTTIAQATLLADLLTEITTDRLPADSVTAIRQSMTRGDKRGPGEMAHGIRTLAEAKRLNREARPLEATPKFADALARLESARSPLAGWASCYLTLDDYYQGRLDAAATRLVVLNRVAADHSYLALQGQILWMLGLVHLGQARLADSTNNYLAAHEALERIHSLEGMASLDALLATNLDYLGDSTNAWIHRQRAMMTVRDLGNRRPRHTIVQGSVRAALDLELPRAALRLQNAAVENARDWELPPAIAEAYLRRSLIHADLGDGPAAARDLSEARLWLPRISDKLFRSRIESELPRAEADIAFAANPATAIDSLSRALEISAWSGSGFERASLHRTRGQAYLAAGNVDAAESDYRRAIDLLEEQRTPLVERLRISFFDRVWNAFDEIIALEVFERRRPDLGLEFAERGRARALLDSVESSGHPASPTIADRRQQLPSGTVLLYYAATEKALLSWLVARDEARFVRHPISRAALFELASAYKQSLERADSLLTIRDLSTQLYEVLVRPQEEYFRKATTIIVVPDGPLHDLPFAGLLNPRTGRFFVEDHAIGLAPSAAVFAEASAQLTRRQTFRSNLMLVVGNPVARDQDKRLLPALPNAEAEAAEVGTFFKRAQVLTGSQATKQRFLAAAADADLIHFAGHAIANPGHPLLSRLLLTADSTPDSGTLFGHELQKARLPRVRLVVLAGCSTAVGSAQRGEGVLSLARSFVAAGVPSVVASLWSVDDLRSRVLFRRFYAALSRQMSPVDALRMAQLAAIAESPDDARALSTWAAFVAIGGTAPDGN